MTRHRRVARQQLQLASPRGGRVTRNRSAAASTPATASYVGLAGEGAQLAAARLRGLGRGLGCLIVIEHREQQVGAFDVIAHQQASMSIEDGGAWRGRRRVRRTLAVRTGTRDVLAVITAARRLDLRLVGEAVGDSHVRLATEEEFNRDVKGYELGALPPLGALAGDNVYRSRGAAARQWWLRWRAGGELFGEMGGTHRGLGAFSSDSRRRGVLRAASRGSCAPGRCDVGSAMSGRRRRGVLPGCPHAFVDWVGQRLSCSVRFTLPSGFAVRVRLLPQKVWASRPMGSPRPTWANQPAQGLSLAQLL
jgi:Aminoacyl-tRNA editing domain